MIIDVHAHLFHPSWYPESILAHLAAHLNRWRNAHGSVGASSIDATQLGRMLTDGTGEATIRIMDKVGIEKRVILIIDWGVKLGDPEKPIGQIHKEVLSICKRFPDRLVGFAGIDPRRKDATQIVERAFDTMGAQGLKLHPTTGWSLRDDVAHEVVALAAARRLPVLVHVGKTLDILSDRESQPEALVELARAFPESPFIAGHSGFDRWTIFAEQADTPRNLCFDVSGWQELAAVHGQRTLDDLAALVETFPGRVFFGTDSPFYTYNLPGSEAKWLTTVADVVSDSTSAKSVLSCPLFSGNRHSGIERR